MFIIRSYTYIIKAAKIKHPQIFVSVWSIDSFVSFSYAPIRYISYLGIIISFIGFLYSMFLIINKVFFGIGPTGWTSIMVIMLFLGGIQLITLGIIGEYVWRGVDESRRRPLYLVSEKINFENADEE